MPAAKRIDTAVITEAAKPLLARAAALLKDGQPGDAIAPLREAALLAPDHAPIHHDLGLACLEAGHLPEAIAALHLATQKDPRSSDAFFRLGIAFETSGDFKAAMVAYTRATERSPGLTEAWFRAGAIVYLLGHRREAIACFRRAAATGGNSRFGRLGKARALLTEDRNPEAEKVLRHTVALDPQNAMAHDLLGNLLTEYGRFAEARACFENAISIAPRLAGSYYELVRCRPVRAEEGLVPAMQAALDTPGLDGAQKQRVHLAIGKAADDLGDYALAMQHLVAANALRRDAIAFDADKFDTEIEKMMARLGSEQITLAPSLGCQDVKPILIVGMPRSGTTLVEQIISSHPDVSAAGELHFWNQRGPAWLGSGQAGVEKPFFAQAATDYLALLRTIAPKAHRVTDKMPFNFLWAGLIHLAFPHATIVHCRRAAVDTALSIQQTYFHPGLVFPTGGEELVRYVRTYQRLMAHWRALLPGDRLIEVDYEQLATDPEPVIRTIIAGCRLPWSDDCLHPEKNQRAVRTPSKWQARQPIYPHSVARWRRYEPWLGPLRTLL